MSKWQVLQIKTVILKKNNKEGKTCFHQFSQTDLLR